MCVIVGALTRCRSYQAIVGREKKYIVYKIYTCFSKLLRFDICHDVFSSLNAAKIVQVDWFVAKTCTRCYRIRRCPLLRYAHLSDFFPHFFFKFSERTFANVIDDKCVQRGLCQLMQYAPCESDILIERFTVPTSVHRSLHMLITMKNSPIFFFSHAFILNIYFLLREADSF